MLVIGYGSRYWVLSATWTWHLSFSKEYHAQRTISGMCNFSLLPCVEVHEWFLDPRKEASCTIHKRQRKRPQTNHISFIYSGRASNPFWEFDGDERFCPRPDDADIYSEPGYIFWECKKGALVGTWLYFKNARKKH